MSNAIDARADQSDYPLRPDAARHETDDGLRDRLSELAAAHPSSADYARDDRDMGPEAVSPSEVDLPADRRTHILDGDPSDGGGHRPGTGHPDKTEFPAAWSDDRITDAVLSVARNPDQPPERQDWNERWQLGGTRDGVSIVAIVEPDGTICTAWPLDGSPGVVRNPVKDS